MKGTNQITFGLKVAMTVASTITAILVAYFTTVLTQAQALNDFKLSNSEEHSSDRSKISALEANNQTLEKWLTRVEGKLDAVIKENN